MTKQDLQKRLEQCSAALKQASAMVAAAEKQSVAVSQATEGAKKVMESVKFAPPSFSAAIWSKTAQKLGASAAELAAVKSAESKGTRAAFVVAVKAISANKKLAPVVASINSALKKDNDIAAKLKAIESKAAGVRDGINSAAKLIT